MAEFSYMEVRAPGRRTFEIGGKLSAQLRANTSRLTPRLLNILVRKGLLEKAIADRIILPPESARIHRQSLEQALEELSGNTPIDVWISGCADKSGKLKDEDVIHDTPIHDDPLINLNYFLKEMLSKGEEPEISLHLAIDNKKLRLFFGVYRKADQSCSSVRARKQCHSGTIYVPLNLTVTRHYEDDRGRIKLITDYT